MKSRESVVALSGIEGCAAPVAAVPFRDRGDGLTSPGHRLLVVLPWDRCLARPCLGARAVALSSAAHVVRVARLRLSRVLPCGVVGRQ
jgi:hypothetical protein